MIVIHIESGLGNQMLSYCEYLALKYSNPNEEFYLETIVYEIPECNEVISQWNGYELDRIFNIDTPKNIRSLFSEEQWYNIIDDVRKSAFWEKNWNYPVYITQALNRAGLKLKNLRGNFELPGYEQMTSVNVKSTLRKKLINTKFGYELKRLLARVRYSKDINQAKASDYLFMKVKDDIFTGQWLKLRQKAFNRDLIDDLIHKTFVFPKFTDQNNLLMAEYLNNVNGVAIHARRGDMLSVNGGAYKYGYFKRAVKYIKKHVQNPVFVFFTNTGSINWCKENLKTFALDIEKDTIKFVDWNTGLESYRDMQLMSYCKHAIITNSSFGWWGAYFIQNPDKITVSTWSMLDTTNWF